MPTVSDNRGVISAAALALRRGDPLTALNHVALRDEAPALALRGIALAQLGEFEQARGLLKKAARAFGPRDATARARCVVAQAEIALVSRDLAWSPSALESARATLEKKGDLPNAAHARHLQARRCLLVGRLAEAERLLGKIDPARLPPPGLAAHEMALAGLAMRRLRTAPARAALARAHAAARLSRIPALIAEVEKAARTLDEPAARLGEKLLRLDEVETLLASRALVVDACRHTVRLGPSVVPLASRPILFTLARALAEAWPAPASRAALITRAFHARTPNDSHRARLRVELGRLRKLLHTMAAIRATAQGFLLAPRPGVEVKVLAWPRDEEHAAVLALVSDGEAWSSSALALALSVSQRTVQRALDTLAAAGKVHGFGRGRARRWTTPAVPGFATILLLPASFENP